ncbi:hypothetical protein MLD38_020884 [Melastoma candidum]|uniref:Uncharacterized protein n=1 Tax=Melastoma candidum TaxID=119954 RepID=A0ACB9QEK3_9MYRT|nr:hypothetical protein MLD38_020884 [Melastoma candidum]
MARNDAEAGSSSAPHGKGKEPLVHRMRASEYKASFHAPRPQPNKTHDELMEILQRIEDELREFCGDVGELEGVDEWITSPESPPSPKVPSLLPDQPSRAVPRPKRAKASEQRPPHCWECERYHEEDLCPRRRVVCRYCRFPGHSAWYCWAGYPGWR